MRILAAALTIPALAAAIAAGVGAGAADELDAVLGKALFERDWVPAPASTDAADGLGPLFAARSCAACHVGAAFAARFTEAPEGRVAMRGMALRLGDAEGRPDPRYGKLLQAQSVQGLTPEGRAVFVAQDGAPAGYALSLHLERGALAPETRQSLRLAPPLVGRAALDRIDAAAILALADPDDHDGDGISGRASMVATETGEVLGRYGWKAETANLEEQVADAFAMDMGLSSRLRPLPHGDCTSLETDCTSAPTGESESLDGHELSDEMIRIVAAYLDALPVSAGKAPRADADNGAALFSAIGCAACHAPHLSAGDGEEVAAYSDLLLHDMGPALDDGVGAAGVASAEWRTAPLIAMQPGNGRRYLHDGRAATLDAAIRAHGGEAEAARSHYTALSEEERVSLVAFVEAL